MDLPFRLRMKDSLLPILREAYNAQTAIIIPGSGTFAMEAVARQFAMDAPTIICRNGLFSFRWSAILETARTKVAPKVLMAQASADSMTYEPCAIATVVQTIKADKPKVVFAPHVETATGIILSDDYLTALGQACREVDALFVLDCVASGAVWVDMKAKQVGGDGAGLTVSR
jgi:aspartate aminotransferase-like enzyme